MEKGKADFIVIGRGLLADPEYVRKLYEDRREDIRPCIKCNRFCLSSTGSSRDSSCSVNPALLKKRLYGQITKSEHARKVIIVGGGVGGMEAARIAAMKGHDVTLYEKNNAGNAYFISISGVLSVIQTPRQIT